MADFSQLVEDARSEVCLRWPHLEAWLKDRFGRDPGLESILFLVGVQSRGSGYTPQLDKEQKQDLIMEGSHVVLGELGLYRHVPDEEGGSWNRLSDIPGLSVEDQESLLRLGVLRYFEQFMDTP